MDPKLSKDGSSKVLVMDFPLHRGALTDLGLVLADELAKSLGREAERFEVVERSRLHAALQQERLDPAEQRDEKVARWLAGLAGASTVVTGEIQSSDNALVLSVVLWDVREKRKLGSATTTLQMTKTFEELLAKKVSSFGDLAAGRTSQGPGPPVYKAGVGGVRFPQCEYCPAPSYTPAARRERYRGAVVLDVVITVQGRAADIRIVRGAAYGLTQQAIEAVQNWRFKPAVGPDGKPIAVRLPIEINF